MENLYMMMYKDKFSNHKLIAFKMSQIKSHTNHI